MILYLNDQFLSTHGTGLEAIQLRRAKLGLSSDVPCMLICDAFTGNFAFRHNENSRRQQWAQESNVLLPQKVVGGWSAHGQPCDAFHHLFRRLTNHFIDGVLGYHNPLQETIHRAVALGTNGQKHLEASPTDNVKSLLFAWQEIQKYPNLLCWAWTSRGLVTDDEMRNLRPEVFESDERQRSTHFKELVPGIPLIVPFLDIAFKKKNPSAFFYLKVCLRMLLVSYVSFNLVRWRGL